MSILITCQTAQLDYIGSVLYGAHDEQLDKLIVSSGKRMAQHCNSEFPWRLAELGLVAASAPRNTKIAVFFLLLNMDMPLKESMRDLCPRKAGGFYETLRSTVIPHWINDERHTLQDLVDALRDAYRNA
eukprot:3939800-Rhodomonas_salina.2